MLYCTQSCYDVSWYLRGVFQVEDHWFKLMLIYVHMVIIASFWWEHISLWSFYFILFYSSCTILLPCVCQFLSTHKIKSSLWVLMLVSKNKPNNWVRVQECMAFQMKVLTNLGWVKLVASAVQRLLSYVFSALDLGWVCGKYIRMTNSIPTLCTSLFFQNEPHNIR